jgi:antitoxin component YwqK of YwqJK toxin-antitoxin module
MKPLLVGLALIVLSITVQPAFGQFRTLPLVNLLFKKQFDHQSRHHGRWVTHSLAPGMPGKTKIKGRYAHGLMVGEWRTYYPNKKLQKLELCRVENGRNIIETTTFYPNGKIAARGMASMEVGTRDPHYFYFGDWTFYKEDGTFQKTIFYDNGWPARTTYADGKIVTSRHQPRMNQGTPVGEVPTLVKKAGSQVLTVNKNKQAILIEYKENGDSTVTQLRKSNALE